MRNNSEETTSRVENRKIAEKYNRLADRYDAIDWFIPSRWRRLVAGLAFGRVLEVGVGTGLNLPYYGKYCTEIHGIDISIGMLEKAKERISLCSVPTKLEVMDIQAISLESASIDSAVATFVFCTVPDFFQGLRECHRILKPGGRLILLEHMGSDNKLLRPLMNWLNPLTMRLMGDNINRDTAKKVANVGFNVERLENLMGDVVRLIVAGKSVLS